MINCIGFIILYGTLSLSRICTKSSIVYNDMLNGRFKSKQGLYYYLDNR